MKKTVFATFALCAMFFFALSNTSAQTTINSLSTLPEADTLIYISPQRLLTVAAPRVVPVSDLLKMRAVFNDVKSAIGVDPARIEYVVIAIRFHKPTSELNFVAPDVMAVVGGDFSADSLITTAKLYAQDKLRDEKYGSKTLAVMKIDQMAEAAEKNPLLKSFVEVGIVPLSANSIAIGNLGYLHAAVDAADGSGRIDPARLTSLLRDPNTLLSAAGSPLGAFAKSFGMLGTETTPRESRCDTRFGEFYAGVTMGEGHFSLRGAMNADNPDTAKIINGLLTTLLEQAISSVPDKNAQSVLKGFRMLPKESEVVLEAEIPEQVVADFVREQMAPKQPTTPAPKPATHPVRRRRSRK